MGIPRSRFHKVAAVALTGAIALFLPACGGGGGSAASVCDPDKISIAYQPGLGYAGLLVVKQAGTLEKEFPDVEIEWRELNSGSAIRDGMIAKEIQVGAGGIGPFLVGYDSGIDWKVLTGLNRMNLFLMAKDPNIEDLDGLEGGGSIAMPAPDSIQAMVLKKGADEELGDPTALDSQIVAMGHPDGVQALVAGQLDAHLTSPPFQGQEEDAGARAILKSYDLFGEHTFNSVYTTTEFEECNSDFTDTLAAEIADANKQLTEQPEQAAPALAKEMGEPVEEVEKQITDQDVAFTNTPSGFMEFAEFMHEIDMLKELPEVEDLFFENDYTADAS